jgi:DNA polymerase III delta prime subunit
MKVKFNNVIYEKGKRGKALKHLCFSIFKQYLNKEKDLEYKVIQKKFNLQHCTSQSVVLLDDEWEQKPEDTKRRYFSPISYNNLTLYFLEEWGNLGLNRQGKNCDNINHMVDFAKKEKLDIQILNSEDKQSIPKEIKREIIGNLKTTFQIKTLLLKGVPGTGKSRAIENIINEKLQLKDHKQNILRINIHSASSNADLMQGIGISSTDGKIEYKEKQGLILNFIEKATFNPNQPFVLVLEEIQENSLNELIGDLIYLIEDDKRAKGYEADDEAYGYQELVEKIITSNPETAYVEVPYLVNSSTEYRKMIMPDNLYIFCTSNYRDDKKVIEDNLLRRFEVLEIYPKTSVVHEYCRDFFEQLNENILTKLEDEIHPDRFLIGHSNWLKVDNEQSFYRAFLKVVVEFKDIKEVEFNDFKEIIQDLPLTQELNLNSYKSLIEDVQTKARYDFLD